MNCEPKCVTGGGTPEPAPPRYQVQSRTSTTRACCRPAGGQRDAQRGRNVLHAGCRPCRAVPWRLPDALWRFWAPSRRLLCTSRAAGSVRRVELAFIVVQQYLQYRRCVRKEQLHSIPWPTPSVDHESGDRGTLSGATLGSAIMQNTQKCGGPWAWRGNGGFDKGTRNASGPGILPATA